MLVALWLFFCLTIIEHPAKAELFYRYLLIGYSIEEIFI